MYYLYKIKFISILVKYFSQNKSEKSFNENLVKCSWICRKLIHSIKNKPIENLKLENLRTLEKIFHFNLVVIITVSMQTFHLASSKL